MDIVNEDDIVYFVDCLNIHGNYYENLMRKTEKVIVIDHHATSKQFLFYHRTSDQTVSEDSSEKGEDGRLLKPYSAALLCYKHFFDKLNRYFDFKVPDHLQLISDHDIWNKETRFGWNIVQNFHYGLCNLISIEEIGRIDIKGNKFLSYYRTLFEHLLCDEDGSESVDFVYDSEKLYIDVMAVIKNGKEVAKYIEAQNKNLITKFGIKCSVELKNPEMKEDTKTFKDCILVVTNSGNSSLFEETLGNFEDFDLCIINVPLYTENGCISEKGVQSKFTFITGKESVHAGNVCSFLDGGGHKGIGGCKGFFNIEYDDEKNAKVTITHL